MTFSFDSFWSSHIPLKVVSLQGKIDVIQGATSITETDTQPQLNASQRNTVFFLCLQTCGRHRRGLNALQQVALHDSNTER